MSRVLIAYYSRTGTSHRVAEQLQLISGWPSLAIADVQSRSGFFGDLRCMSESLLFRTPPYEALGPDPAEFDQLVLVAPIWMGQLASPMRSFLYDLFGPRKTPRIQQVALVCVMGLQGAFNAAEEVARIIGKPPLPVLALRQAEVLDGSGLGGLEGLVQSLRNNDGGAAPAQAEQRPSWLSPEAS